MFKPHNDDYCNGLYNLPLRKATHKAKQNTILQIAENNRYEKIVIWKLMWKIKQNLNNTTEFTKKNQKTSGLHLLSLGKKRTKWNNLWNPMCQHE